MGEFTKLAVWKRAHALAPAIYRRAGLWPRREMFGLTSQTRRASISVPANIAEGCGRNSDAELARFSRNSLGSASELSYYVILARELDYLAAEEHDEYQGSISEVRRMLASLEDVAATAAASRPSRRRR